MSTYITDGPRGRRFLYELLGTSGEDGQALVNAVWERSYPAKDATFRMVKTSELSGDDSSHGLPTTDLEPATPAEIARTISTIRLDPTPEQVSDALANVVASAAYWQEPDSFDVTLAEPAIHAALAAVDEEPLLSLLRSDSGETESASDKPGYLSVFWQGFDEHGSVATILSQWHERVVRTVERSRRDRPDDPAAPRSGMWHSNPPYQLKKSNGMTPRGVPEALRYVEDGPPRQEALISTLAVRADRLYVIDSADDWAELCHKYPLDVTAEVRQDWFRVTGRDGRWVIPNWLEASLEWDGALLTKRAYLSSAGTAIPVGDAASVIAGWNPGETYWLTDAVEVLESQRWKQDASGDWVLDSA